MLANDFLLELFRAKALDVKTMLENSSYPFATKILEAIKRNEEAVAKGESLQGIPQELMAQLQASDKSGLTLKDGTSDEQHKITEQSTPENSETAKSLLSQMR
jgi:hypothetical protein